MPGRPAGLDEADAGTNLPDTGDQAPDATEEGVAVDHPDDAPHVDLGGHFEGNPPNAAPNAGASNDGCQTVALRQTPRSTAITLLVAAATLLVSFRRRAA